MLLYNELTKKIIAILVIIPMILGGFFMAPQRANGAAVIYDPLEMLDKFIITPLVRQIANSLENKVVNKVNGLIANIDGKSPSYITNWRNYILESEARGNDVFRAVLADTALCPYFKNDLVTALGAEKSVGATLGATVRKAVAGQNAVVYQSQLSVPGMPSFQQTANCTLSSKINVNSFKNDFSQGGWEAWNQLIQPQNNFFGAYSLALGEQSKQTATEEKAARDSSVAGSGFKGQKLGADNKSSPNGCAGVSLPGQLPSQDALLAGRTSAGVRCAFLGEEVTPASILGQSAANSLDAKIGRVGTAAALTDVLLSVLAGVITGLSDRITNFGGKSSYGEASTAGAGFDTSGTPTTDPNFDSQTNQMRQGGQNSCRSNCIQSEYQNCDQTDESGLPDQPARQACQSDAEAKCTAQCSSI
jgi:uncharacterized protein (UPF0297 family)